MDSDNEKENLNSVRKCKAKKEQFNKIDMFLKQFNEETTGKKKFSALWTTLITDVNAMGPPAYTESEWKMKWSQHKYNLKRKQKNVTETSGEISIQSGHSGAGGQSLITESYGDDHTFGNNFEDTSPQQNNLRKLCGQSMESEQITVTVGQGEQLTPQGEGTDGQSSSQGGQSLFQDQPSDFHVLEEMFENTSTAYEMISINPHSQSVTDGQDEQCRTITVSSIQDGQITATCRQTTEGEYEQLLTTETDGQSSSQGEQSLIQDPSDFQTLGDVVYEMVSITTTSEIAKKLDVIIEKMDTTNSLLEVIARRA